MIDPSWFPDNVGLIRTIGFSPSMTTIFFRFRPGSRKPDTLRLIHRIEHVLRKLPILSLITSMLRVCFLRTGSLSDSICLNAIFSGPRGLNLTAGRPSLQCCSFIVAIILHIIL